MFAVGAGLTGIARKHGKKRESSPGALSRRRLNYDFRRGKRQRAGRRSSTFRISVAGAGNCGLCSYAVYRRHTLASFVCQQRTISPSTFGHYSPFVTGANRMASRVLMHSHTGGNICCRRCSGTIWIRSAGGIHLRRATKRARARARQSSRDDTGFTGCSSHLNRPFKGERRSRQLKSIGDSSSYYYYCELSRNIPVCRPHAIDIRVAWSCALDRSRNFAVELRAIARSVKRDRFGGKLQIYLSRRSERS